MRYGIRKEATSVQRYLDYMGHKAKTVRVFKRGCVVNPKFPWLSTSQGRIVYNEDVGFGLIEVKCNYMYSKRIVSPEDACFDPRFYGEMSYGKVHIEKES